QKKNKENFQEMIARSTPQEVTEFDKEKRHQGGGITEFPVLHNYQRGQNVLQGDTNP
ncbi:unnamed protein product, partial [Bubo scandiacus]